ncbi:MAG: MSCRAMM family protein [Planctomycetota bacterium]|jgi:hypothetical protein
MGRRAGWPKWAKWDKAGSSPPTYSITGTINDADGNGLDGVTVTLTGDASDSTVTAGGGAYEFTDLSAGSYTVTPTKAGLTFNPSSAAVTITTANKTAATMASVWEITGTINDSAGVGLSGVLVTLSGDASATDTTDGSGAYSFPNLANGNYTVTPTKSGSTFSPTSAAVVVSGADKVATTMAQVWEISGTVKDWGGAGISGVLVTLSGDASDTDTTDATGAYSFPGLSDGSYTVTPTKTDYLFDPASRAAPVSGADVAVTNIEGWTLEYPLIQHFEADTIGEQEAALEAKVTHVDVYAGANAYVRAIDYGSLTEIRDDRFDNCWAGLGSDAVGFASLVAAGEGWTPSEGNVIVMEGIFAAFATGPAIELYATDAAFQDGIKFTFNGTNFYVSTYSGGTPTQKLGPVSAGLSSAPTNACWFCFVGQYNTADNVCYCRIVELGKVAAEQEDSGFVNVGTVSSPTFNSSTEWIKFQAYLSGSNSGDCGAAQLRVAESSQGYGLGAAETANYRQPTQ